MAEIIKDGTGDGYSLQIDNKNRLRAYAVVEDEATYINRVEKQMYSGSWGGAITAASAGNTVLYVKNTSTTKDMVIKTFKHRCTGDNGTLSVWLHIEGTPGGTLVSVTPSNRNAGTNNTADCEYYISSEITGLTGGQLIGSNYGKQDAEFQFVQPCSGWILPPNSTLIAKADNNTATHYGGMAFYFRDAEN